MEPEQLVPVLDAKRLAGKIFRSTDLGPPVSVDQKPEAAIDVKYITHSFTIDSSKMIFVCFVQGRHWGNMLGWHGRTSHIGNFRFRVRIGKAHGLESTEQDKTSIF